MSGIGMVWPPMVAVALEVIVMEALEASMNLSVKSRVVVRVASIWSSPMSSVVTIWAFQVVPFKVFSFLHDTNIMVMQAKKATNNVFFIFLSFC